MIPSTPLPEVIAASTGGSAAGKKTLEQYERLLQTLGPEFTILRDVPIEDLQREAGPCVAEGIRRLREFFRSLGMPVTFAEIGAKAEDIPDMVAHRAQKPNGFPFGNFVKIQPDDMAEICRLCCR